jgi:para-nitrobenzyl esterase
MTGTLSRRAFAIAAVASVAPACQSSRGAAPAPIVAVESGDLRGAREGALAVYRGIPFAAPPVGALRWRAPERPRPWTGVRSAASFAPRPVQNGQSLPGAPQEPMSEDCLYLNVWTPAVSDKERLPVMVWIYGGGFANGSASIPAYWGDALAKRGAVVVTIAYRVGAFGYFAHPELTQQAAPGEAANFGMLDQIAALEWVQRNISGFGGDPGRVTIWGQSAGSMSACLLMASPRARGLFHRAIGESGGVFFPFLAAPPALRDAWTLAGAERAGLQWSGRVGAHSIDELRQASADQIMQGGNPGGVHPIIDGHLLPDEPRKIFAAGQQAPVPVLIGSNADEARSVMNAEVHAASFATDFARDFLPLPDALMSLYPTATDAEARIARAALERDLRFAWDMRSWGRLHARTAPVFMYHFSHAPPFAPGAPLAGKGACHWAELPYVFDQLGQWPGAWTGQDRALAALMADDWIRFATSGDPNSSVASWPRYDRAAERVMVFGDRVEAGALPNRRALDLFDIAFGLGADPTN